MRDFPSATGAGAAARRPATCLALLLAALVAACGRPPPPTSAAAADACADDAELVTSIYGGLEGRLEWRGDDLECEGMPRPHGEGARLRFAGPATADGADGEKLAFIIALPDLEPGATGKELPAGVTLMEVDAGRFFSAPAQAGCWADIDRQERIAADDSDRGDDSDGSEYRISGLLYCVSPLAELNGTASVSLRDLRFTGRLSWEAPR